MSKTIISRAGLEKLEKELAYLKDVRRQEVAARIQAAISLGDLSENSEYEDAKNQQAFLEGEIADKENLLRNAVVAEDEDVDDEDVISIGSKVVLFEESTQKEFTYTIVGANEASFIDKRISNESPIGSACLGHHSGEEITIEVPNGIRVMRIMKVEH